MSSFIASLTSPKLGTFMGFTDPLATSLVASAGYDFVIIDMEHNPLSAAGVTQTVHTVGAASKGKCSPLASNTSNGASTAAPPAPSSPWCRHPTTRARAVVQRGRYPPLGERSFGPSHAQFAHAHRDHGVGVYFAGATDEDTPGVALIVMLESRLGVSNAEAILSMDGISAAFVGPFDLRCSLGLSGGEGEEKMFVDALRAVAEAGRQYGKLVGMMAPSQKAVTQGLGLRFSFVAYSGDSTLLAAAAAAAARASVREGREGLGLEKL